MAFVARGWRLCAGVLFFIPVGIAYAVWAGTGVALITLIGWLVFKQTLDAAGVIGILFIVASVLILNVFSKVSVH